jgi:PPK2 family polyphosphate:nucleotide phosphotransferase
MAVHDIDVEQIDMSLNASNCVCEVSEVGGQERWCDLYGHDIRVERRPSRRAAQVVPPAPNGLTWLGSISSLARMETHRITPGTVVDLGSFNPAETSGFDGGKQQAKTRLRTLNKRLEELQEVLYAQGKHKVLIVLQATDTGGKDGTIRHVFEGVNPQGVKVASFKKPTPEELAHDYLWRIHAHTPGRGEIVIFNRSHYEDVLVVRVHSLVDESSWSRRYDHINEFERILADEGTTILKFFLHISKEEQAERLRARLVTPNKQWKFAAGDLAERELWDKYQAAFADMLSRTSTAWAPWHVVPADRKWYRNLVVSEAIIDALGGLNMAYPPPEDGMGDITII